MAAFPLANLMSELKKSSVIDLFNDGKVKAELYPAHMTYMGSVVDLHRVGDNFSFYVADGHGGVTRYPCSNQILESITLEPDVYYKLTGKKVIEKRIELPAVTIPTKQPVKRMPLETITSVAVIGGFVLYVGTRFYNAYKKLK